MRVSPDAVPGLDDVIPAADLASLTGMPQESEVLDDLCSAQDVSTGFDQESPLVAEITARVVAAVRAAFAWEASLLDGGLSPRLDSRVAQHELSAATQLWRDLAGEAQPRVADANDADDVARLFPPRTPSPPADGQICAVLAVDIAGFTRPDRDDIIRRYLHEQLYEMVRTAFDDSGVPWASCFKEDRGDGIFVVIPPEISAKGIIGPFPERLCGLIRRHNHLSCEAACLQLRAAVHIGPVDHDGHGFIGTDVNHMFRILEARQLKHMLAASGAELAMAVSDYVYRSLVCRYPSLGYPDAFRAFRFQVKQTRGKAWTYLPGRAHGGAVSD
jgi:hypothetical protein